MLVAVSEILEVEVSASTISLTSIGVDSGLKWSFSLAELGLICVQPM